MEISRQLGLEAEAVALDQAIGAGLIGPPEYAQQVYALWAALTEAHVAAAFDSAPWLARIREVWAEIRAQGDYCAVISLSPSFFVERLTGWGAHAAYGSRFPAARRKPHLCSSRGHPRSSDKSAQAVRSRSVRRRIGAEARKDVGTQVRLSDGGRPRPPFSSGTYGLSAKSVQPRSGACRARTPSMLPSR